MALIKGDPENGFANLVGWVKGCEPKVRLHFDQETGLDENPGCYRPWKAIAQGKQWTDWHRTPAEAMKEAGILVGRVDIVLQDGTVVFSVVMP